MIFHRFLWIFNEKSWIFTRNQELRGRRRGYRRRAKLRLSPSAEVEDELRAQEEAFNAFHADLCHTAGALADLGLEVLREQAVRHLTSADLCSRSDLETAVARRAPAAARRRSRAGVRPSLTAEESPPTPAIQETRVHLSN